MKHLVLKYQNKVINKSYLLENGSYIIDIEDSHINITKDEMNQILLEALKEASRDDSITSE